MKRNNPNIQKTIDGLINKTILRFIPHSVKPNYVTIVRFLLIPVIYWLFQSGNLGVALIVFVIAASTDFIDGAMARTRNQITDLGKVIDPIADKLLIMSVLLQIGLGFLVVKILILFIGLELIAVLFESFLSFFVGRPLGANIFGKIKLILQSFGVGFLMLGAFLNNILLVDISLYVLSAAILFAVLASLEQIQLKIKSVFSRKKGYDNGKS